jgi:type VI secretion system secreted protein Hcp
MALDMFIKVGAIKGESKDVKHKDEIDVLAWSWGLSQSGTTQMGGGGGSGKVSVQDLSFTKYLDTATPPLVDACCKGTHETKATLTLRKAGDKPLEYLIITMDEVLVTSVSTGGSGGEDRITENVTLNFAKFKLEYTEQTEKGGAGAKPKCGWNMQTNAAQ